MSETQATFVESCLRGKAGLADIDSFVERWHLGDDARPHHEFLGLTAEEYAAWVRDPDALRFILLAHARGIPLSQAIAWAKAENAAGAGDPLGDPESLAEWLKKTERI